MAYVKAEERKKRSPRRLRGEPALSGGNHNTKTQQVDVPPPMMTPVRSPTPEEILETLRFMFAVGIECSCPLISGNQRVDQLRDTGHYEMWQTDLKLVRDGSRILSGMRSRTFDAHVSIHSLAWNPGAVAMSAASYSAIAASGSPKRIVSPFTTRAKALEGRLARALSISSAAILLSVSTDADHWLNKLRTRHQDFPTSALTLSGSR